MSKKHFITIAQTIRHSLELERNAGTPESQRAIKSMAGTLASDFASFNPNFDRARFLAACGVEGGAQ